MRDLTLPDQGPQCDPEAIQSLCPDLDTELVRQHLARLEPAYLERFGPASIALHTRGLAQLSDQHPVEVILEDTGDASAECTILAFDHRFEFALITGVMAGTGFRIETGDVFTLARLPAPRPKRRQRPAAKAKPPPRNGLRQAVIIDRFRGRYDQGRSFAQWADPFRAAVIEVLTLLDKADDESVQSARRRANELVVEQLSQLEATGVAMLPVELDVDQLETQRTRLRIVGQDTPAFLYSLSTALSLHGLSIQNVLIRSVGNRVEDEVDVVDADNQPIHDPQLLERVRLSVLLTKQFTYFLDRSPDPVAALSRFGRLTEDIMRKPQRGEWFELLRNPRTMEDLAKLLGTSDFLWEDFIRAQYESLLPVFTPHLVGRQFVHRPETMPLRMAEALQGAETLAEQQDRLNKFKDHEIFLIDLDHILDPGVDFRELSARLTWLAESFVSTAARLVYADLVKTYGTPQTESGADATYAIFGLGKLGGVALGYASDIELLFVYAERGQTTGGERDPVDNARFFNRLVQDTAHSMKTKREGIFQVDLRLRPYGKEGALAASLKQFRRYYAPDGPAHPFERLALARMRWIAGDPPLGYAVEQARDELLYQHPDLDMDALWETWAKHRRQKVQPGTLNAKYSPGALVDLEGVVQLLQVRHARRVPQLRAPRLSVVIGALRRAEVLTPGEYAELVGAYHFLRKLINALRMLRGNAQDLFVPPADSDELLYLARRMGYEPRGGRSPAAQLLEDFDARTAAIRAFVERHFDRPCPGT